MYFTYILQSKTSGKYYIGQTNDLEDRLYRHNAGHNKSTKGRGPWVVVYSQLFESRDEAVALERKLKRFKNPSYMLQWISTQDIDTAHPDIESRES